MQELSVSTEVLSEPHKMPQVFERMIYNEHHHNHILHLLYLYSLVCNTVKDKIPDIQGGSIIKRTFQEALNAVSVPGASGYQARRGVGERGENC